MARILPERPDLLQLRRQAKELLGAFVSGDADAATEVAAHYRGANRSTFALHDAQLVLARAYGFDSWPKLRARVDGVTVARLVEAVRADDRPRVRAMLDRRPELVNMDTAPDDERCALHHAVSDRRAEMVRLLMRRGADARKGVHPRREATSALTIAREHGYHEIVAIITEEEQGRRARGAAGGASGPEEPDELVEAVARGDAEYLRARHAAGTLANRIGASGGLLTAAVQHDQPRILELLLDLGFDPDERTRVEGLEEPVFSRGMPLQRCAATGRRAMAELLLKRGADPNGEVHASGTPVGRAYGRFDWELVKLACPLSFWNHIPWIPTPHPEYDRSTYLTCFRLILRRCHADVTGRFGRAILHDAAASYDWILPHERVAFAATLLDAGARLAVRDDLLRSTPLGWACRWGWVEIVELLLERGADPVEPDAEEWARPVAWAEKMGRSDVLAALREHGP